MIGMSHQKNIDAMTKIMLPLRCGVLIILLFTEGEQLSRASTVFAMFNICKTETTHAGCGVLLIM